MDCCVRRSVLTNFTKDVVKCDWTQNWNEILANFNPDRH